MAVFKRILYIGNPKCKVLLELILLVLVLLPKNPRHPTAPLENALGELRTSVYQLYILELILRTSTTILTTATTITITTTTTTAPTTPSGTESSLRNSQETHFSTSNQQLATLASEFQQQALGEALVPEIREFVAKGVLLRGLKWGVGSDLIASLCLACV